MLLAGGLAALLAGLVPRLRSADGVRNPSHRDPATALDQMIEAAQSLGLNGQHAEKIKTRADDMRALHEELRRNWNERAHVDWNALPMTAPRLSSEIWNAIEGEDWVQAGSGLEGWNRRLWDWTELYRFTGGGQGTGTSIDWTATTTASLMRACPELHKVGTAEGC